jgi:hypothetical protein
LILSDIEGPWRLACLPGADGASRRGLFVPDEKKDIGIVVALYPVAAPGFPHARESRRREGHRFPAIRILNESANNGRL